MNVLLTTLNAKYIHKNLALRYLYVTKPKQMNCQIREFTIKDNLDRIVEELCSRDEDVIGFSVYIWNIEETSYIVKRIKALKPQVILVLGGPEVSFDGAYFVSELGVDAVICGEGEFVFWQYLEHMEKQLPIVEIAGVFTAVSIPKQPYATVDLTELESYPKPYFLPFDLAEIDKRYFYVETSRGCPYQCRYCLSSVQGKVRLFSMSYVMETLIQLFQQPIKQIKFLDRTFNVDKHRALQIAQFIQENARKDQIFQFELMAEYVSDELIAYLINKDPQPKFRFEIGIQSTNQQSLREISRYQDFDRLKKVIESLQTSPCSELHVDLIAGLPYENLSSFQTSFNEVFSLQASELQLGFLKLLRGTTLRQQHEQYGMQYHSTAPYEVYETAWLSQVEMQEIHEVCFALDALYNTPRLQSSIQTLLQQKKHTAYQLFHLLGKEMYGKKYKQLDELFHQVSQRLQQDYGQQYVEALLAVEYYSLFKQRPKRFYQFTMEKVVKQTCYELLHSKLGLSMNELINYGLFDKGYYDGTIGYLFVLYNKNQQYPKRYFIKEDGSLVIDISA